MARYVDFYILTHKLHICFNENMLRERERQNERERERENERENERQASRQADRQAEREEREGV